MVAAIALVNPHRWHAVGALFFVLVSDDVAPVVVLFADQPAEDARRIRRIRNAAFPRPAVPGRHVLCRKRAPAGVCRIRLVGPSLDSGECLFNSGTEALNAVGLTVQRSQYGLPAEWRGHGHQVFGVGEDENVRPGSVLIGRKSPVGLARDRREGQRPTEAERPVSGAGIVRERELRAEIRTPGTRAKWYDHRGRAGHRVGGELLANAANSPAAFGKRDRRCAGHLLRPTAANRAALGHAPLQQAALARLEAPRQTIGARESCAAERLPSRTCFRNSAQGHA